MLLETAVRKVAERVLLLTLSLQEEVRNGETEQLNELLNSRAEALRELEAMDIDSGAAAILEKVRSEETLLMKLLQQGQAGLTNELIRSFTDTKSAQAYRRGTGSGFALDQTG